MHLQDAFLQKNLLQKHVGEQVKIILGECILRVPQNLVSNPASWLSLILNERFRVESAKSASFT